MLCCAVFVVLGWAGLCCAQLIHGDLHYDNVLCDPDTSRVSGLLDFEFCAFDWRGRGGEGGYTGALGFLSGGGEGGGECEGMSVR